LVKLLKKKPRALSSSLRSIQREGLLRAARQLGLEGLIAKGARVSTRTERRTTNDERLKKSLCIRKNTEEGDEEDQDGPGPLATSRYIAIDTVLISGNRLYKLDRRIPVAAMVSGTWILPAVKDFSRISS
jgi:hypothetical protein